MIFEEVKKYVNEKYPGKVKIVNTKIRPEEYKKTESGLRIKECDAFYDVYFEINGKRIPLSYQDGTLSVPNLKNFSRIGI